MKRIILAASLCCAATPVLAQDPAPGGVYELVQVETMPQPTNVPEMRAALEAGYPAELRAAGRQGTVVVSMVVTPEGETREVAVVNSSDPAFDSATVAAVRLLRFRPAAVEGRAVAVRVELPIQWQLAAAAVPVAASAPSPASSGGLIHRLPPSASDTAADTLRTYELSGVELQPRIINRAALRAAVDRLYPEQLRRAGVTGTVQVRFRVDAEGKPSRFRITSSTNADFDRPTLDALRVLRFRPARVNGRPVAVWVELPIAWRP